MPYLCQSLPQPVSPCIFSRICVFSVQGEAGALFRKAGNGMLKVNGRVPPTRRGWMSVACEGAKLLKI